ncbi:kinase [Marinobacter sp. VGCF2001]|uniref:kinase n=1 Tax=Marinobacter sp. VGCF2001 TaxID=3417189 RepID=UPI003CEB7971
MSDNERRFTVKSLIVTGVAAIVGTVMVLEASGRIDHSDNKDHAPVGEFTAIHVKPGDTFRMSRKSSELHAVCENGYLAIAADVDPSFRGILVDYKNRGVRCARPSPTDRDPAVPAAGDNASGAGDA